MWRKTIIDASLSLYSDKTYVFDQSERAQGPIYVTKHDRNRAFSGLCSGRVAAALALMTVITQLLLMDKINFTLHYTWAKYNVHIYITNQCFGILRKRLEEQGNVCCSSPVPEMTGLEPVVITKTRSLFFLYYKRYE